MSGRRKDDNSWEPLTAAEAGLTSVPIGDAEQGREMADASEGGVTVVTPARGLKFNPPPTRKEKTITTAVKLPLSVRTRIERLADRHGSDMSKVILTMIQRELAMLEGEGK